MDDKEFEHWLQEGDVDRQTVHKMWENLSVEQRAQVCRLCVSYFPKDEGFQCLSGHGDRYARPCTGFQPAVFRLCREWSYTPRQVFLLRQFERDCKMYAGVDLDAEEEEGE